MSHSLFVRVSCTAVVAVLCVALDVTAVLTQRGGTAQTENSPPVNNGSNPYRVIRDWAQLQIEKREWGGSNGVAIDRDGRSVWATDRCSPGTTDRVHPGWRRGIRIGSLKDGKVTIFVPPHMTNSPEGAMSEGLPSTGPAMFILPRRNCEA
jgi:hypothetical protein